MILGLFQVCSPLECYKLYNLQKQQISELRRPSHHSNPGDFDSLCASESPGELFFFFESCRCLGSTPRYFVSVGQEWDSGFGVSKALQVILKCRQGWKPFVLVSPAHFINEAVRVQRGCDTWKDTQAFSGGAPSEAVCFAVNYITLRCPAQASGSRLTICHKRLDSKYFRLCGSYDPLSYTNFLKNHIISIS